MRNWVKEVCEPDLMEEGQLPNAMCKILRQQQAQNIHFTSGQNNFNGMTIDIVSVLPYP